MQPQPLNDCEVALTLNNARLCTESFPGFVVVGFGVPFLRVFFCCSLQLSEFSQRVLIFATKGVRTSSSVLGC